MINLTKKFLPKANYIKLFIDENCQKYIEESPEKADLIKKNIKFYNNNKYSGKIEIEYCPEDDCISYYFNTKISEYWERTHVQESWIPGFCLDYSPESVERVKNNIIDTEEKLKDSQELLERKKADQNTDPDFIEQLEKQVSRQNRELEASKHVLEDQFQLLDQDRKTRDELRKKDPTNTTRFLVLEHWDALQESNTTEEIKPEIEEVKPEIEEVKSEEYYFSLNFHELNKFIKAGSEFMKLSAELRFQLFNYRQFLYEKIYKK